MFAKMTKYAKVSVLLGILGFLLLVAGIYRYQQHTVETMQERIYAVPDRSERQPAQPATAFQRTPVHSTPRPLVSDYLDQRYSEAAHDHESDASMPADESDFLMADDLGEEDISSASSVHDAEQARIDALEVQLKNMTNAINEKYPEISLLSTISVVEFDELYPTPEERIELAQTLEKARGEFLGEFRSLFSQVPVDVREEALANAHGHFTTYMGQGMADAIMTEVRSLLEQ